MVKIAHRSTCSRGSDRLGAVETPNERQRLYHADVRLLALGFQKALCLLGKVLASLEVAECGVVEDSQGQRDQSIVKHR